MHGDLALIHATGSVFHVLDAAIEQPRADRLEISPTGPLFGYRMTPPEGRPAEMETELFEREELSRDAFRAGPLRVKGARRPLRFGVSDAHIALGADARGSYLELRFALPRGCYATTLLRELFVAPAEAPEVEAAGET
jgi:tRNA pseudouridine13 synthase